MICATASRPYFCADVFDDVRPAVVGEINVNIRRVDAFGVEEALEQQPVADRVHVGNPQQVSHDGPGGGPARHAGDALLVPVADEVADDQEVADEPGLLDHLQLELQPVHDAFDRGRHGRIRQTPAPRAASCPTPDLRPGDRGTSPWTVDCGLWTSRYVGSLRASSTLSTTKSCSTARA